MSETSICPACDGRPKREHKAPEVVYPLGMRPRSITFAFTICDLCAGEGRIDRNLAREVWRSAGMSASA